QVTGRSGSLDHVCARPARELQMPASGAFHRGHPAQRDGQDRPLEAPISPAPSLPRLRGRVRVGAFSLRLYVGCCVGRIPAPTGCAAGCSSYSSEMSCFERSLTVATAMKEITAQIAMYQAIATLVWYPVTLILVPGITPPARSNVAIIGAGPPAKTDANW